MLRRARDHGIQLVTGVDAGAAPAKPHGIVGIALAALTDGGFSIADAVASATAVAARACGLAEVTGRLEPGLAADVLVVDGDLERDITALQRPAEVLVRGGPSRDGWSGSPQTARSAGRCETDELGLQHCCQVSSPRRTLKKADQSFSVSNPSSPLTPTSGRYSSSRFSLGLAGAGG